MLNVSHVNINLFSKEGEINFLGRDGFSSSAGTNTKILKYFNSENFVF